MLNKGYEELIKRHQALEKQQADSENIISQKDTEISNLQKLVENKVKQSQLLVNENQQEVEKYENKLQK